MTTADLLCAGMEAMQRETAEAADSPGALRRVLMLDAAYDVVDMVRRITSNVGGSLYEQEKAREGVLAMVRLWLRTVDGGETTPELERVRDELTEAIGRAFEAVRELEGR